MGGGAVPIHVLSRDGQSILGSRDTLTGGGAVPIHVLSRDGQSILGSRDTLTGEGGGGGGCSAHPCTLPGWSEYLGISVYSDRGGGVQCPSMYSPGMVRVSWDLGILRRGGGGSVPVHVLSKDGQSTMGL